MILRHTFVAVGTAHDSPAVASEGAGVRINDNIDTFEYDVAQHKGEQKSELKVNKQPCDGHDSSMTCTLYLGV